MAETGSADKPDVLIRPPTLALITILLGWVLDWAYAATFVIGPFLDTLLFRIGMAASLIGVLIVFIANVQFFQAGTPVQTTKPVKDLVTSGLYRYSRNPIYVGLIAFVAGVALMMDAPAMMLLTVVMTVILRFGVIAREEAYLERRFPDQYPDYKAKVRRWF